MATSITCFRPSIIQASYSPRKPNPDLKKPVSSAWWSPLFGWSSDPDYIPTTDSSQNPSDPARSEPEPTRSTRPRLRPGGFTEEKAKQLRKKTVESSSFHDKMYHSAIASRLASDLSEE